MNSSSRIDQGGGEEHTRLRRGGNGGGGMGGDRWSERDIGVTGGETERAVTPGEGCRGMAAEITASPPIHPPRHSADANQRRASEAPLFTLPAHSPHLLSLKRVFLKIQKTHGDIFGQLRRTLLPRHKCRWACCPNSISRKWTLYMHSSSSSVQRVILPNQWLLYACMCVNMSG